MNRHASISGVFTGIRQITQSSGEITSWIEIISDGKEEPYQDFQSEKTFTETSLDETLRHLQQHGLITLDSAAEPLHQKINRLSCTAEDLLVVRVAQLESYVSSHYSLAMSQPLELLRGAEILKNLYGAGRVIWAIEQSRQDAAELLRSKIYFLKKQNMEVLEIPDLYPMDHPTQLQKIVLHQFGSKKSLVVVEDAATVFAVYEAMVKHKPLYERVVSLAGECLAEAKNSWVRFGSSAEEAMKAAKGILRDPKKLIFGGPMLGHAQENFQSILPPSASALLALPPENVVEYAEDPCTRCGKCVEVCPEGLEPAKIGDAFHHQSFAWAQELRASDCMVCGNCSYICPSHIPLAQRVLQMQKPFFSPDLSWTSEVQPSLERDAVSKV